MTETADPSMTPAGESGPRRETWLWAGVIVLLTLIVYQPAMRGEFLWDDDRHVSQNRTLRSTEGLRDIWLRPSTGQTPETFVTPQYYPLTHTTYWVEYRLWGLSTVGYHVVNVLLHAGTALLLWQVLVRLAVPGAWVAGAVFAVHPIEVESVAWITERKNVLAGVFFLGSVLAYVEFAGFGAKDWGGERKRHWGWYAAALALFALAVLSKTVASVMPGVMVLVLWWKRRRVDWREMAGLLPFFVVGAVLGRQTAWMEKWVVGAVGPEWDLSFTERLLVAGRAFWFYVAKLLWPAGLTFTYPRWEIDPGQTWQWLYLAAAVAALLLAGVWWLIGRRARGVAVAVLAYAVMLFPAMGFFNVYPMRYSFVADHFQYFAGMAIVAAVVGGIARLVWRGEQAPGGKAAQVGAGVLIAALAVLTWRQAGIYASPVTLWRDTIAKNPGAWMARYNLGREFARQGLQLRLQGVGEESAKESAELLAAAAEQLEETVRIRPEHDNAWASWGTVLVESGKPAEALPKLARAIELDPDAPEAHTSLGLAAWRLGRTSEAQAAFERATRANPRWWQAYLNLGLLLAEQGKLPDAAAALAKAAEVRPQDGNVQHQFASVLARLNRPAEALAHMRKASELLPNDTEVWTKLGYLWMEAGRRQEAWDSFANALRIDEKNARAMQGATLLVEAVKKEQQAATTRATTAPTTGPSK